MKSVWSRLRKILEGEIEIVSSLKMSSLWILSVSLRVGELDPQSPFLRDLLTGLDLHSIKSRLLSSLWVLFYLALAQLLLFTVGMSPTDPEIIGFTPPWGGLLGSLLLLILLLSLLLLLLLILLLFLTLLLLWTLLLLDMCSTFIHMLFHY
jgi:hypothetical protein